MIVEQFQDQVIELRDRSQEMRSLLAQIRARLALVDPASPTQVAAVLDIVSRLLRDHLEEQFCDGLVAICEGWLSTLRDGDSQRASAN